MLKKVRVEPYVSITVEAANRRANNRTGTDGQRSSYMQAGVDSSRNTGGRTESADNRNVTVNSRVRIDQNTYNGNAFSGSNSCLDDEDGVCKTHNIHNVLIKVRVTEIIKP